MTQEKNLASVPLYDEEIRDVELRDPLVAGILAWLVPGLGHFYQRRTVKAVIYCVCILSLLFLGIWMGSYQETIQNPDGSSTVVYHLGRNVYCSWKTGDKRLYFIPQAFVGAVAIPAILQANTSADGSPLLPGNLFVPPRLNTSQKSIQPTMSQLMDKLHSYYELGTIFVAIAGLLNLLAIFDAVAGPVWLLTDKKESKADGTE